MDWTRVIVATAVGSTDLALGLAVYLRNRRGTANRRFFAFTIFVVIWLATALAADSQAIPLSLSILANRVVLMNGFFMGTALLEFTRVFPVRFEPRIDRLARLVEVASLIVAATALIPGFIVADVRFTASVPNLIPGPAMIPFAGWAFVYVGFFVWAQRARARHLEGRAKAQNRLVTLGTAGFLTFGTLFGLVLPMLVGSYDISAVNYLAPLFIVGFVSYGMIRHRLMDMRRVVLRLMAYSASTLLSAVLLVLVASLARSQLVAASRGASDMLFAGAALLAVFAFQPVRASLDRLTDRFFYRRTYTPRELLRRIGAHLTSAQNLQTFATVVSNDLAEGMRLTSATVVYEQAGRAGWASSRRELPQDEIERLLHLASPTDGAIYADDPDTDPEVARALSDNGIRVLVPMCGDGSVLGVLLLGSKKSGDMFSREDAVFLDLLAPEAAVALLNARLYADLEHTFLGTISALAAAVDAREGGVMGQVHEVTEYSMAIAAQLGLGDEQRETLRTAAMLHDIGRIGSRPPALVRPGSVTAEEEAAIRAHPEMAATILEPLAFLHDIIPLVRHHHESWDGSGYPDGLAGEQIPLGARIIAVADAYYSMTSVPPARGGLAHDDAVVRLYAGSGTEFDPKVVEAMLAVLSRWHGNPSTWRSPEEESA